MKKKKQTFLPKIDSKEQIEETAKYMFDVSKAVVISVVVNSTQIKISLELIIYTLLSLLFSWKLFTIALDLTKIKKDMR